MTLAGYACWTTHGVLRRGIIREQHFNPDYCIVEYPDCAAETHIQDHVCITLDGAIKACEESADYWERQAKQLREKGA